MMYADGHYEDSGIMQAPAKNQTRSDAGLENSCGANPPACLVVIY